MASPPSSCVICVLDAGYASYEVERNILRQEGCGLRIFEGGRMDRAGRIAFAADAVGIFVGWTTIDAALLDALPKLRYIVRYGVGYDNVDLKAAAERGIRVCNVQGYASHSVSDHALALMLACLRGFPAAPAYIGQAFGKAPHAGMREARELTLGIVGLGRIGSALCPKAKALFRDVVACDPYVAPARFDELQVRQAAFAELLATADVISIHCNLSGETAGMFDAAAFAAMRPAAILVNTARGPIVSSAALLAHLEEDTAAAAGLDVFEQEPPAADDPLLQHPRVVATGHYAWYSAKASQELQRRAAENMAAMLRGEAPEDLLQAEH